jgi:hypothetical protein
LPRSLISPVFLDGLLSTLAGKSQAMFQTARIRADLLASNCGSMRDKALVTDDASLATLLLRLHADERPENLPSWRNI